jgi:hypothetical protein
MNDFSPDDRIDLQVEAMIGYVVDPGPFESEVFVGEVSGWSNTQTVVIPADLASNPLLGQSLDLVEVVGFVGVGIAVALLVVVAAFLSRKIRVLERKLSA